MGNIADKYIKIDFHIHSHHSSNKDGDKVKDGTKENLPILVSKLKENEVDMCAITDHNCFSYDMYSELKKYEAKGDIMKVLPGVEFDLFFDESNIGKTKDIHAIVLFDDTNDEKTKLIEDLIRNKIGNKGGLTEGELRDLLANIDLNCVIIVHQKSGPESENENSDKSRDLGSLGVKRFNDVISADYFDAVEFKNYKTEGYLIGHKNKYGVEFKSLCGSDCHVWTAYPHYDEEDKESPVFAYIKALPTFKGLAMAITGEKRISTTKIVIDEPYLKEIKFRIHDENHTILFSRGLNVIIGDNSVGKSFFLESIDDEEFANNKEKKKPYNLYKKKLCFKILNRNDIDNGAIKFLRQGEIRTKFEGKESIEDESFLRTFFKPIDCTNESNLISNFIDKFISNREAYDNYIQKEKQLNSESFVFKPELSKVTFHLQLTITNDSLTLDDYKNLIIKIGAVINALTNLKFESGLTEQERKDIDKHIDIYEKLKIKYQVLARQNENEKKIYSGIVKAFNKVKKNIDSNQTCFDNEVTKYSESKTSFINRIIEMFKTEYELYKNDFNIDDFEEINIEDNTEQVGPYKFVSSLRNGKIKKDDIKNALSNPLIYAPSFYSIKNLSISDIYTKLKTEYVNRADLPTNKDKYKKCCMDYIVENHLTAEKGKIIPDTQSIIIGNSMGLNAQYYLDIYADKGSEKIFIIDQPEDDVSEMRISQELIPIMRKMANKKQIIFVTHNPELVVNLDVDNVVVIKSDNHDKISIFNGALEYEDKEHNINILNEIATLLDGGAEVIRKRWKRYDKR